MIILNNRESHLKPPAPFLWPPFDNYFFLCEEFNCIHTLPVHIAEERVLPSTEREKSHWRGHSDIDANIPRFRFVSKPARRVSARCKQTRLISVAPTIHQVDR